MISNGPKCFKPAEVQPRTICARSKIDNFTSLCHKWQKSKITGHKIVGLHIC